MALVKELIPELTSNVCCDPFKNPL